MNISLQSWSKFHRRLASGTESPHRGFGTHFVTISVGNPPQPFRLAVATESDHTSLPCSGCSTCQSPLYEYSQDSVSKCPNDCAYEESSCDGDAACEVTVNYSDHIDASGYNGIEVTDIADIYNSFSDAEPILDSIVAFPLRFVCQQESFGSVHVSGGVLGMSNSKMSFINQLHRAGKISHSMFSLCFRPVDEYPAEGSSAGHVTFGHVDRSVLDSPLIWADNQARGNYAVHIRRIYMGKGTTSNKMLEAFSMGTLSVMSIDDSNVQTDYSEMDGTLGVTPIQTNEPITYLHKGVEAAFKATFKQLTGKDYITPYFDLTEEEYLKLPTIFLQVESQQAEFGGSVIGDIVTGLVGHHHDPDRPFDVTIAIPPENYIVFSEAESKAYPTIYFEPDPRIASNILQNHEIVFDIGRQRIGFAHRYSCPAGLSVKGKEVCIDEHKTCDDGSIVSRDPNNNCEFAVCADVSLGQGGTVVGEGQQIDTVSNSDQSKHGLNLELDGQGASNNVDGAEQQTRGNGISMEFDGQGASNSASENSSGRTAGTINKIQRGRAFESLPEAEGGIYQALKIGPGAIEAQNALKYGQKSSSRSADSVGWSAFGFFLFFFSFFLTAFFTNDNVGYYAKIFGRSDKGAEDDTDNAMKAWERGNSFYNVVDKREAAKKQESFNRKQNNKKGYFGVGDNEFMSSRVLDTGDDQKLESGSDRPYFEKLASGRAPFVKSLSESSDKSSEFFGVSKPTQFSPESEGKPFTSDRPYYDKSTKGVVPQDQFKKPVYKKLGQSDASLMSTESSSYKYPQKPDFSKFVKPVNSDDRSVFSRSSRSAGTSTTSLGSSFYSRGGSGYDEVVKPHPKQLDDDEYSNAYSYSSGDKSSKPVRGSQQDEYEQSADEYSYDSRYDVAKERVQQQYDGNRSLGTYTYGSRFDDVSKPSTQQKKISHRYNEEYSTSSGTYTYGTSANSTGTYTNRSSSNSLSKPTGSAYEQALKQQQRPQRYGDEYSTSSGTYTYGSNTDDVSTKYSTGTYTYGTGASQSQFTKGDLYNPQKPSNEHRFEDASTKYSTGTYTYGTGASDTSSQEDLYNPRKPSNQHQPDEYSDMDSFVSEGDLYNPTKPSNEFQDEYEDDGADDSYGDVQSFYG
eukprot:CAMPEP_0178903158 /NCGR_PEP_ID=MMETSP0786-20121207/5004_1 /TAXON_ID=186022 /ORGANISM="Thalassionema frauenfeldii, Strain CCMP 1798" /LENGTH=1129 /DNA_ID=CAMNT_0020574503 /DNA_START=118 /DNA_END=3507 /DNA_ORIENTATION=+